MRWIKFIKKQLWWRVWYKKFKLTPNEVANGRCIFCHAGNIVNKVDKTPMCNYSTRPCPCKMDECLKMF